MAILGCSRRALIRLVTHHCFLCRSGSTRLLRRAAKAPGGRGRSAPRSGGSPRSARFSGPPAVTGSALCCGHHIVVGRRGRVMFALGVGGAPPRAPCAAGKGVRALFGCPAALNARGGSHERTAPRSGRRRWARGAVPLSPADGPVRPETAERARKGPAAGRKWPQPGRPGGASCPNLLQRPGSGRDAGRESLIFRASSRGRFRRGAPLQQIRTRPAPDRLRSPTRTSAPAPQTDAPGQ